MMWSHSFKRKWKIVSDRMMCIVILINYIMKFCLFLSWRVSPAHANNLEFTSVCSHELRCKFASSLHRLTTLKMLNNICEGISLNDTRRNRRGIVLLLVTIFARKKFDCVLKSNYTHSKTHLKSYYIEKCLRLRKFAKDEDFFLGIVYFASLHGEVVDMENFLQILQCTMKILAMPDRLSTILMANYKKFGPIKRQKDKLSEKYGHYIILFNVH